MGARATLTGFPEVVAVDIFQGSGAKPGQIVVDTLVRGSSVPTDLPRQSTLTITARNQTLEWRDMRIAKAPRQYGSFMRTVFEDSRWMLHEAFMPKNFNSRDCEGVIYPETDRTIGQLVQELGIATGLAINTADLPGYKPSAPWRGLTAGQSLDHLLFATCCRIVYSPASQVYIVSSAGSGALPDFSERFYRPVPAARYGQINVRTAPITYEKKFQCNAVVFNESNDTEVVQGPERIFDNFSDIAEVRLRSKYIHSAMRLWKPNDQNTVLLGRRALSVSPGDDDSAYAAMVFTSPENADVPKYGTLAQPHERVPNELSLTGGGAIFQCSQAHLMIDDGGAIKTTAEILSAYHNVVSGELERMSQAVSAGGTGVLTLDFDWIRPVVSIETDIDGAEWTGILNAVLFAVAAKYANPPQHVTVPTMINHGSPGRLGGVRYVLKLGSHAECYTVLAIDFDPTDARLM